MSFSGNIKAFISSVPSKHNKLIIYRFIIIYFDFYVNIIDR